MPRLVLPVAALSLGVGLAIGAATIAQDQTGPDGTLAATPAATRCAEPAPAGAHLDQRNRARLCRTITVARPQLAPR